MINSKFKIQNSRLKQGFTLVEMLIALAIFSTVVVVGIGMMFAVLNVQKRIIFLRRVHDNVRFTIESMSRELRTAITVCATTDLELINNGKSGIKFTNARGKDVVYFYDETSSPKRIERYAGADGTECDYGDYPDDRSPSCSITDQSISIDGFDLASSGFASNNEQPRIRIVMRATAKEGQLSTTVDVENSVSLLEIKVARPCS